MTPVLALIIIAVVTMAVAFYRKPLKKVVLPAGYQELLQQHVAFYRALDADGKRRFETRIRELLGYIRIHGVQTQVEDLDRLLIAASGVIPVFGFEKWRYNNLRDVLLYEGTFNREDFSTTGYERDTLGMVGTGPMQMMMILSKPALREGFDHTSGRDNVGIHEFVHLLDKEDGEVDGTPVTLINEQYRQQWQQLMAENIAAIREGRSDINYYGGTNQAEFLAVVAEYFFSRPVIFRERHPELYGFMTKIFRQEL